MPFLNILKHKIQITPTLPTTHPPTQNLFQPTELPNIGRYPPKTHLRLECFAPAATFFKADPQTCPTWEVRRTLMPYIPGREPSFSGSILIFKGSNALEIPKFKNYVEVLVWPILDSSCLKKVPNKSIHFNWREVWKAPLSLSHNKMVRRFTNMDTARIPKKELPFPNIYTYNTYVTVRGCRNTNDAGIFNPFPRHRWFQIPPFRLRKKTLQLQPTTFFDIIVS